MKLEKTICWLGAIVCIAIIWQIAEPGLTFGMLRFIVLVLSIVVGFLCYVGLAIIYRIDHD